jgi:hypothetical protein
MRMIVLAVAALLLPGGAVAQTAMPEYDPATHCRRTQALLSIDSQSMLNACLRYEQTSYDGIRPRWDTIPDAIRRHCIASHALISVESYGMLSACIRHEETSLQNNQQFQFRR